MTDSLASLPFKQLLNRVRACTLCAENLPYGPRPVIQMAESARILVVGQAPGCGSGWVSVARLFTMNTNNLITI